MALAHTVLADLRDLLPKIEKPAKARVEHRPAFLPDPWVFGFHRLLDGITQSVRPLLARVRDLALRIPVEIRRAKRIRAGIDKNVVASTSAYHTREAGRSSAGCYFRFR